ncbi:MAG: NAD(P)H-dependent oxidoreductase [Pseudomonadota bacterium]
MGETLSILAFSGSTRRNSYNHKLLMSAVEGAKCADVSVTQINLRDYPMPIYDGDYEEAEGIPETAKALKKVFLSHQGLLLASPEYNSSISGVLKNTIDWLSRREEGEAPLVCFKGKVVSLMSASPGALGGLRGLVHVRAILGNIGCIVLPEQVAVPSADQAFDADGRLLDDAVRKRVEGLGRNLAGMLKKLYR